MRLLLDTHIFLWFLIGDKKLEASFRDAIRDPNLSDGSCLVNLLPAI